MTEQDVAALQAENAELRAQLNRAVAYARAVETTAAGQKTLFGALLELMAQYRSMRCIQDATRAESERKLGVALRAAAEVHLPVYPWHELTLAEGCTLQ